MPENEQAISFVEVKSIISQYGNKQDIKRLLNAIDNDAIGCIFGIRKGNNKFQILRYRTGRFVKRSY